MTYLVLHIREFAACHWYGLWLKPDIAAIMGCRVFKIWSTPYWEFV